MISLGFKIKPVNIHKLLIRKLSSNIFRNKYTLNKNLINLSRRIGATTLKSILMFNVIQHGSNLDLQENINYEIPVQVVNIRSDDTETGFLKSLFRCIKSLFSSLHTAFFAIFRFLKLTIIFTPLVLSSPLLLFENTKKYYYSLLLVLIQLAGPIFMKYGQWAGTRPDLFSKEFCSYCETLHTNVNNKKKIGQTIQFLKNETTNRKGITVHHF